MLRQSIHLCQIAERERWLNQAGYSLHRRLQHVVPKGFFLFLFRCFSLENNIWAGEDKAKGGRWRGNRSRGVGGNSCNR